MKPSWVSKTDPDNYPLRFLGNIWQQQVKAKFGVEKPFVDKEWGQLKTLRSKLGDLTQELIEWVIDPVNWWHFCQEVRKGWKTIFIPDYPDIGFLLGRRGVALRVMHSKLSSTPEGADLAQKIEGKTYQELKTLLLATCANGKPERVAKIEAAKTLTEMQQTFVEMISL